MEERAERMSEPEDVVGERYRTLASGHGVAAAVLNSQLLLVPAQDQTCEQPITEGGGAMCS